MSFGTMKVSQLKDVAEYFAVDLGGAKTKNEILALLEEEGLSYDMYQKFNSAEPAEIEVQAPKSVKKVEGDTVLVKMTRANPYYEINGFIFTRNHPYVAMGTQDAEYLFENQEGFQMATPREVQEYYG